MEWLLKIVEGPMNGAEIALVNGMRVSFGRDVNCDIVIADVMLAEKAFELDVTAESVSLVPEGGEPHALVPFEIQTFGATSFALGPAAGEWQELRRPVSPVEAESLPRPEGESLSDSDAAETPPEAPVSPVEESPSASDAEDAPHSPGIAERPPRTRRVWLLVALVVLASLFLVGVLGWLYWPKVVERHPQTENTHVVDPKRALADIASAHSLRLRLDPSPCLSGNLKRRTERLAIRALAQAADPAVKFDLTDDETLRAAAEALLFTVTEGSLKVTKAANRKVAIAGQVASAAELTDVLRAMSADVAGLEDVDAMAVKIGCATVAATPRGEDAAGTNGGVKRVLKKDRLKPLLQVAGILMVPYPCVVMHDGMRCTEGAIIGQAKLVKIEADRLTFEQDGRRFEWRP